MRWRPPSTVGISVCPPRLRGVQGGTDLRDHQSFFFSSRVSWTIFFSRKLDPVPCFCAIHPGFFCACGSFFFQTRQLFCGVAAAGSFLEEADVQRISCLLMCCKELNYMYYFPPSRSGRVFFFVSPSRGLSRSLSLERERAGGGGSGGREGKSCTVASLTIFMGVPSTIFMVVPSTACSPPHCLFRFAIRSCQAGEPGGWTGSAHSRALSTARGVEGVEGGSGGREWREGVERGRDTCTPGEGHVTCTRRVHTICRRD